MPSLDERDVQRHNVCWHCKYFISDDDNGNGYGYCLLDLPKKDRDHIYDSFFTGYSDAKTLELLGISRKGAWFESPRGIAPSCSCQFFERPKYDPMEERDA